MASKQEMDMEALHAKLDTILDHLGLTVNTSRSARLEAEERGRKAWAPGGERWLEANGGAKAQVEMLEGDVDAQSQSASDAEAYEKSEMAKRTAVVQARMDEAKAEYDSLRTDVKEEKAAIKAEAESDGVVASDAPKKSQSDAKK